MDFNSVVPNGISFTEFITRRFRGHESKIGMVEGDSGEAWTYGQIKTFIHNIGSAFARRGLKKGDVVATIAPNSLEHMATLYAVPAVGGILSGMNPIYTTGEIQRQIEDCTASYVVTSKIILPKVVDAVKKCPKVKEIFVIGEVKGYTSISEMRKDDGSCFPAVHFDAANDLAFLPYSSGTTGLPKGVMLTHRALMIQLHLFADHGNSALIGEGQRCITMFPFYHIAGMGFCGVAMYQHCTSVIIGSFDFEAFLQMIEKYRTNALLLPPPVLLRLAKDPLVNKYDLSCVDFMLGGAAPIPKVVQRELSQRFKVDNIKQAYGMTETAGATHVSKGDGGPVYGSAGSAHPLIPCKIIDIESGKELTAPGERGEVWVHTPCAMKGYWRNPEKTRDTLDEDGWIHTGDIAYRDAQDNLFIVDRLKELIKYKGFQVAPAELEALLLTHPDIADVAVIGIPDERAGEVPAAYVVVKEGHLKDPKQIADFVAEHAAPYKHLRGGVHFRDDIPKNLSGKILRRVLRDQVLKELKVKSKI